MNCASRVLLTAGLAMAIPALAQAQTFTLTGGGTTRTVRAADDFGTVVVGDAWDMNQASDHVYMFSTGWSSGPGVASGRLSGTGWPEPRDSAAVRGTDWSAQSARPQRRHLPD